MSSKVLLGSENETAVFIWPGLLFVVVQSLIVFEVVANDKTHEYFIKGSRVF
jgi:hypothetical protein